MIFTAQIGYCIIKKTSKFEVKKLKRYVNLYLFKLRISGHTHKEDVKRTLTKDNYNEMEL